MREAKAMPLYDYRCNACGKTFEIQQKMADPDLTKCEASGEDKLEKVMSWVQFGSSTAGLYSKNPKLGSDIKGDKGKKPKT